MIDLNITILIQFVNFLVTLVVLNILLIRPVRDIIRKRREIASGQIADTEDFTREAEARLRGYESSLAKAREEGAGLRESSREAAVAEEGRLLAQAQDEAQAYLHQSREETRAAIAKAAKELSSRVPELAARAADRLLSTPTGSKA